MKILIYGLGKFAEYISFVLTHDSKHEICAFCIEENFNIEKNTFFCSLPIVEFENIELHYPPSEYGLFIAIGNNEVREKIFKLSKKKGYHLISHISSKAIVWNDLKFGENVFLSEDSGVQPFVSIGDNTILIGSKIGHHSIIGNNVLLSCSYVAGNVKIGDNSFLGLNSSVKQNTIIGRSNIIGMGSIVENDTNDCEIFDNGKSTRKRSISSDKFKKYL